MNKMKKNYYFRSLKIIASVIFVSFVSLAGFGQISGTVFRDFNGNGTKQNSATFNEPGIGGSVINAYNSSNALLATQTTSSTPATMGQYSFPASGANSIPAGTSVRLEFEITLQGDYATAAGGTSVQFLAAPASNVDLGINYLKDYVASNNPIVSIPVYCGGSNSPGTFAGQKVFVSYPWNKAGTGNPTTDATNSQIGAVWGTAYQRSGKSMFVSAILKRHCDFGNGGLGGIYKLDYSGATASSSLFMDLDAAPYSLNLGTFNESDATRGLSTSNPASIDADAFGKVGKTGLGGLCISDDENTLYSINLFEKKLIKITIGNPASAPGSVSQYLLPDPGCTNGVVRPWAVEFYRGLVYVGIVCSAENGGSKANLTAYIYTFDPAASTFSGPLAGFPINLNYPKGGAHANDVPKGDSWNPWSDNANDHPKSPDGYYVRYPQPILSDIDFTPSGNLVLSFTDRAGNQWGFWNFKPDGSDLIANNIGGDILMFWKNGSNWQLESNGTAGIITGCGAGNGEGPGGGEFFCKDLYATDHEETSNGSVVINPALNTIKAAVMDPITYDSGGTTDFSLNNGNESLDYQIYNSVSPYIDFGKANGLGEIEMIEAAPPIEIGNRVWNDTNANGIQDAGEAGIAGIQVQLISGATVLSTATTDANGNYIFSSGTGTSTAAFKYGITQLIPNTNYIIRVPTSTGGLNLTTANAGSKNTIDSDAPSSGDVPILASEIPMSGANNHTFDIGYSPASCSITTTATPGACESNTYTLTGNLTFSNAPATGTLTVNVAGGGSQVFNAPFTSPQAYSIAGLAADGASHTVTAVFSADANCTDSETYTAPASCSTPPCCTECTAPDGNHWMKVENLGNPADGPSYSTVVNGNTIVHDDPDQVGRGVVPYTYFIRDGFVTYKEYLAFLNAVDPTNSLGFREGLYSDNGNNTDDIFTNNGTSWSFAANFSNCHQNLTAAQLENMTIHKISYNSAARFCNWKATGNIETGAYTFEPGGDAWKKITNINYSHPGPRLPNEDEYYKASYWNSATNYWNLFGTNSLDANGLPIVSSLNPDGTYTNPNGIMYKSTLCPGQDVYMEKYPRQGAKSPCGLFMTLGGYHDWINPRTPSYPIEKMTIRTGNEYAWEDDMKSSFYDNFWYSSGGYYPSPSFRLVTTVDPCAVSCSLSSAGKTNEACNNNGTPSNSADDYITFSLNPTGTGIGSGYTVTASSGATVTPTSGTYGSATNFRLQNGSANGTTYTITVTDNATGACQVTTTVMKTSCSSCPTSCFYTTSWYDGLVLKYDGELGTPSGSFGQPYINYAYDAEIGPDGMLYVVSQYGDKIIKFNPATGAHLGDFVTAGSGGLDEPTGLTFGPDGNLYVSGTLSAAVHKYNGTTGASMGKFVDNTPAGVRPWQGIEFGPDGNLYVANENLSVEKYNGTTGAYMLTFAPTPGGHLQDLTFGPDGNLYLVEQGNNRVTKWNPATGSKISNFISTPGASTNTLTGASFGPDGNFYLAHWEPTGGISKYDGTTGAYIGEFIAVERPKEVLFVCGTCSEICSLTSAGKSNEACNSNNTQAITTDDYITFSLNPTGTGLGTGYTVTASGGATVTPTSGTYGSATNFQLQNGSANGTTYTITVTDNATGACQVTTTVMKTSCSSCPTPDCLDFQVIKN